MNKFISDKINWIKQNKLITFLIAIILYLVLFNNTPKTLKGSRVMQISDSYAPISGELAEDRSITPPSNTITPQPQLKERKVITNSQISLQVKNVSDTITKIQNEVESKNGYVVNTNVNTPGETSTGSVTIRIPSSEIKSVMEFLRNTGVKVVSEKTSGNDITDQYVNIEARLSTLNKTKAKYEEIFNKATDVNSILTVQDKILQVQGQIDSLEGQLKYLEASSKTSLITVTLSTDDLALPYAPDNAWRPEVVFKQAVRSLVMDLRNVANTGIWAAVYIALWGPVLGAILLIKKVWFKKQ